MSGLLLAVVVAVPLSSAALAVVKPSAVLEVAVDVCVVLFG